MNNMVLSPDTFTVKQVKQSPQCRYYKINLMVSSIIFGFLVLFMSMSFLLPFAVAGGDNPDGVMLTFGLVFEMILAAVFIPFIVYYVVRYRRVLSSVGKLPIYRVTLDKPQGSYWFRTIYYTVSFNHDGQNVTVDTTALFSPFVWLWGIPMNEYNNKDVYVYYDAERESVYVIGKVDDFPWICRETEQDTKQYL